MPVKVHWPIAFIASRKMIHWLNESSPPKRIALQLRVAWYIIQLLLKILLYISIAIRQFNIMINSIINQSINQHHTPTQNCIIIIINFSYALIINHGDHKKTSKFTNRIALFTLSSSSSSCSVLSDKRFIALWTIALLLIQVLVLFLWLFFENAEFWYFSFLCQSMEMQRKCRKSILYWNL